MKTKVYVVIPNWNGEDHIVECLNSLSEQTQPLKIIVVDNGSSDDSVNIIKDGFPSVEVLEFPDNAGFAGGVNRGIKEALKQGAQYIALFNNDAIADKNWLRNLVNGAEKTPKAGIITGKFMRMDKKHLDSTGENYSTWAMPFPRGRNQEDTGQLDTPEYVFGASGGASLYKARMLKEIGLFDEEFFAYFEDVDISYRAQMAGWRVWYEPKAVAYHHIGATSSKLGNFTRYHATKNFYMTYAKNMPAKLYWKYGIFFLMQAAISLGGSIVRRQLIAHIMGVVKAFANTPHLIRERRRIQSGRKVTIDYIDSILYKGRPPKIPKI
jgi:GT2 family glycosyltransferase